MTTLRQIIIDAYREGGITQIGVTPEGEEFDEGFRKLQTLIRSLIGNELGVPLTSYNYGDSGLTNAYAKEQDVSPEIDSYYVPANSRLLFNIDSAKTVYLDPNPQEGSRFGVIDVAGNFSSTGLTVVGNGRLIEGSTTLVLDEDSLRQEWFYRDDIGEWVPIETYEIGDQSPFPSEFDDLLITLLAIRLNPRFQKRTDPETIAELERLRSQFKARYSPTVEVGSEAALTRLNSLRYYFDDGPLSSTWFARGIFP